MYELKKLERYLRVNLLGPGPRFIKKILPGRGLTKVEKHCSTGIALVLCYIFTIPWTGQFRVTHVILSHVVLVRS